MAGTPLTPLYRLSPEASKTYEEFLDDSQVAFKKDHEIYILVIESHTPNIHDFLEVGKPYIFTTPQHFEGKATLSYAGTVTNPIMDDTKLKPVMQVTWKNKQELVDLLNGFLVGGYRLFNGEGMETEIPSDSY
jgi:hypothetical protein